MTAPAVARARMLLELDRDAEARTLLTALVAQDPDDPHLLCLLAQSCLGVGDAAAALTAAQRAVQLAPDDEWPYRLLSIALARRRAMQPAREAAATAVRLAPDEWQVHVNRAHVDALTCRVDQSTHEAAWRAVLLAPHEAETHAALGSVLLELRRMPEAEQALREALRLNPQHYSALNDLARIDLRRHRLGRAARGFADAAALSPDDQAAARNLHVVLAQLLRRMHWVLIVAVLAVGAAATHHGSTSRVVRLVLWVATVVVAGVVLAAGRVGSRRRTRRVLGVVLRRDRLLALWAGLLLASFAAVTVAAFAGSPAADAAASLGWLAVLAGTVTTWLRAFLRRSSSSGGPNHATRR